MNETQERVSVGWFLYDLGTKKVLIHQGSDKDSGSPAEWDYFGGEGHPGEPAMDALQREVCEELCICPSPNRVESLCSFEEGGRPKQLFYFFPTSEEKKHMMLREGAGMGWFTFDEAFRLVPEENEENAGKGVRTMLLRLRGRLHEKLGPLP